MDDIRFSNGKDHALIVQGRNNTKFKEKKIVKQKKPKSEIEDESLKPTDEDSMKKVKNKGITSKFLYCNKGFHTKKKCFKKNMDIMYQLLDKHNIEVPDELEKPVEGLRTLSQCTVPR